MTMTIPQIRDRLHALAIYHGLNELADLAEATRRRPLKRPRAPAQSHGVSEHTKQRIRNMAANHPDMTLMQIGNHFGVNQGRISEALDA